jgi:hypothetical protein
VGESFPEVHNEHLSVYLLDGSDGQPLVHVHLNLTGGYNQSDLHLEMWHQEVLTDDHGKARLPDAMANLPLLRITVPGRRLCLADAGSAAFSVDRIRHDGLSAPNLCGNATAAEAPGILNVFVKSKPAASPQAAQAGNRHQ